MLPRKINTQQRVPFHYSPIHSVLHTDKAEEIAQDGDERGADEILMKF